jgi:site-specific recombinase XerD
VWRCDATWDDQGLVFTTPAGAPIDPRRDHDAWEQLLVRAGVPDKALHAARHTAASMLLATGTDIAVVQELLGHSDIRVTRGYTDVAKKLKEQAVTRIASALLDGDLAALLQRAAATNPARD